MQYRDTHVNHFFLSVILIIISAITICSTNAQDSPEGRRLREIVEDRYPQGNLFIGSASHHHLLSTGTANTLAAEFSYVTPANKFKQSYIHPEPDTWRWEHCDDWVKFAERNNQVMRLHAPISPQSSTWVKNDGRTAAELQQILEEYISALCKRYNAVSHIKWLDVVNEAVNSDGTWFGPKEGTDSWENPWPAIGYDADPNQTPLYIKYAFEIADSLAPDLKLIINQHGSMETVMWEKIKQTVEYLRNLGLRVDGIGWQAHVNAGWENEGTNVEKLKSLIEWAHANNLEFHVTENNAWLKSWEWDDPDEREENFVKQGKTFAAIVRTLLPYRKTGVVTWNLWHIQDDECQGYKWGKSGCLWTTEGEPKPGYYQVQRVLELGEDSVKYDAQIKAIDKVTGDTLNTFHAEINGVSYHSNNSGIIRVKDMLANQYVVNLTSQEYDSTPHHFYLHSDTTVIVELLKKTYQVQLIIRNSQNNSPVSGVDVTNSDEMFKTNLNGECSMNVNSGSYNLTFKKTGYLNMSESFHIQSDTTINVRLKQTHAKVKFWIENGNTPIKNARVIINHDTIITNAIGLSTFEYLEIGNTYEYLVQRDSYQPMTGNVLVTGDTTVNINLQLITGTFNNVIRPIQLFPIPAKNQLFVESEHHIHQLIIRDLHGKVHQSILLNSKKGKINLVNMVPGMYILNIMLENRNELKKIIII